MNNRTFCSMLKTERFQSHDQSASKVSSKMMVEASSTVAEDAALGVHFVGEDEVFDYICELDAITEVQEYFDAAGDKGVYIFHFLPKILNVSLSSI